MNNTQKYYLAETARWQKFLGILIMVCAAILALLAVFFIVIGFVSDGDFLEDGVLSTITGVSLGVVYILCGVIYYFLGIYLLRAAKALKAWAAGEDEADLTEGLKNTHSFFRFSGIISIIGLCFLGLVLIGGAVAAISALV